MGVVKRALTMKRSFPFILAFILIACSKKDDPTDPSTPDNNPSALTAFAGDTITVTGKNLGTDIRTVMAKFGTVTADVLSVSETSVTIVVPNDIEESAAKIHLFSAMNETVFNFKLKAPVIESFSPNSGFAGQQVIITGKGFRNSNNFKQISFGDRQLYTVAQSNTSLTIKVPDSIPAGKYTISVTVAGLKTASAEQFEVVPVIAPTFTRFSPETAYIGDTITLEGEHLGNDAIIHFGNVEATVVSSSETAIRVVVPDEIEAASVKLKLGFGETQLTSTNDFQLKGPVIDSIDITSGFAGQYLNIYGRGFRKSYKTDQIEFGNVTIAPNTGTPDHNRLFMRVPKKMAAGKYTIKVTVAGMTAIATEQFEVVVPTITSFTPHSASIYSELIITGTNLTNINEGVASSVSFEDFATGAGGRVAYVMSMKANEIKVRVPDGLEVGRTYRVVVIIVSSIVKTTEAFTVTE
jgi:hypothetical protein